jgi:hypothetical protein
MVPVTQIQALSLAWRRPTNSRKLRSHAPFPSIILWRAWLGLSVFFLFHHVILHRRTCYSNARLRMDGESWRWAIQTIHLCSWADSVTNLFCQCLTEVFCGHQKFLVEEDGSCSFMISDTISTWAEGNEPTDKCLRLQLNRRNTSPYASAICSEMVDM